MGTNIKLTLYGISAIVIIGLLVTLGLKSRKLRVLAAKLLQAQGDLAAQPKRIAVDKEKRNVEVIDVKRKEAVDRFRDLLSDYLRD